MFIFIPCIQWRLPPGEFVLEIGKKLAWKLFQRLFNDWVFPVLLGKKLSSTIVVLFNFLCRESYITVMQYLKSIFWILFLACNLEIGGSTFKSSPIIFPKRSSIVVFLLSFFSLFLLLIDFWRDSSTFSSFFSFFMFLDFLFSSPQEIVVSC